MQTAAGLALITGDALNYAPVAISRRNPLVFWDPAAAAASAGRAAELADIIYPGHDLAFRVTAGQQIEYVRPFRLTITGTAADRPGLSFDPSPRTPWVMPGIGEQRARLRDEGQAGPGPASGPVPGTA